MRDSRERAGLDPAHPGRGKRLVAEWIDEHRGFRLREQRASLPVEDRRANMRAWCGKRFVDRKLARAS